MASFHTSSLQSNSVTRQVNFKRTKIVGKYQISKKVQMRHFEFNFKQCVSLNEVSFSLIEREKLLLRTKNQFFFSLCQRKTNNFLLCFQFLLQLPQFFWEEKDTTPLWLLMKKTSENMKCLWVFRTTLLQVSKYLPTFFCSRFSQENIRKEIKKVEKWIFNASLSSCHLDTCQKTSFFEE